MRTLLPIFLAVLGLAQFSVVHGSADPVTSIEVLCEDWEGYTNKDGSGVYWEVVKEVYEPIGIRVNTRIVPWKRALLAVAEKKADAVLGAYYSQEKDGKEFLYPEWHISVEDPVMIVFKKDRLPNWAKEGIQTLEHTNLAWISGYDFDQSFLKDFSVNSFEIRNVKQGLSMVNHGRVDGLLDYESGIRKAAHELEISLVKDFEMKVVKLGSKLYLAYSNTARSEELLTIFDSRMAQLVESGAIERIYRKWMLAKEKFGKERYRGK